MQSICKAQDGKKKQLKRTFMINMKKGHPTTLDSMGKKNPMYE